MGRYLNSHGLVFSVKTWGESSGVKLYFSKHLLHALPDMAFSVKS